MSLDKNYVLVLNNGWVPIGVKRLKDAISAVYENNEWQLVQIDYLGEDLNIQPVSWKEWVSLEPRDTDCIQTIRGNIRIPTVIISKNYSKIYLRKFKPNKRGIYNRDRGICQYTGKRLTRTNCSVDHLVPKSRGGRNTWDNMVLCDKTVNNKKGSKTLDEFNMKLQKLPKEPPTTPAIELITTTHKDWNHFMTHQSLQA